MTSHKFPASQSKGAGVCSAIIPYHACGVSVLLLCLSGTLILLLSSWSSWTLKGATGQSFGQGAFLVAPLGGLLWVGPPTCPAYPPPGLPAIVHHLLGLATAVQLWGYQWMLLHCCVCVHQALHVVCPPIARASMVGGILGE